MYTCVKRRLLWLLPTAHLPRHIGHLTSLFSPLPFPSFPSSLSAVMRGAAKAKRWTLAAREVRGGRQSIRQRHGGQSSARQRFKNVKHVTEGRSKEMGAHRNTERRAVKRKRIVRGEGGARLHALPGLGVEKKRADGDVCACATVASRPYAVELTRAHTPCTGVRGVCARQ